ncbi:MAG: hypothetical protein ACRD1C_03085 [Terriglobales bacterium]
MAPNRAIIALAALAAAAAAAPQTAPHPAASRTLYLLTATPFDLRPSNLYWVGPGGEVKLARVIQGLARTPTDVGHSGVMQVVDDLHGCLFVITPVVAGVTVAKITAVNEADPLDVVTTPYGSPTESHLAVVAGSPLPPGEGSLVIFVTLGSAEHILPRPNAHGTMIVPGKPSDFVNMLYAGLWVGAIPNQEKEIYTRVVTGAFWFPGSAYGLPQGQQIAPAPADLPAQDSEEAPPEIEEAGKGKTLTFHAPVPLVIVFATPRYLGIAGYPPGFKMRGPLDRVETTQTFVYDRIAKTWQTFNAPQPSGWPPLQCCPEARVFGDWVAYPVVKLQDHKPAASPGPGQTGERMGGSYWYPPTFSDYEFVLDDETAMPGIVWLRNLADRRVIELNTHIRDTEVLAIEPDGTLLYRCDNKIYQSRIMGKLLAPAKLIAQGDDVPEVHWAFWSSQPPPAKPVGLDNAVPHGAGGARLWQ